MNQHDKPKPVFRLHVQEKDACCGSEHDHHEHDHTQADEASHDHRHDGPHHHDHVDACCTPGTEASKGVSFAK